MSPGPAPALRNALELFRSPRSARPGPDDSLPEGMLVLLRVVAGQSQALETARAATGETVDALREAAAFYIQQVMFAADSSSYRILGADEDATDDRLREHYRWLARWLHPDRNSDAWEAVYADRVNHAWQQLRTPERRLQYDQQRGEPARPDQGRTPAPLVIVRREPNLEATAPSRSLRWLPTAILVGLGASAVLTVAVFYVLRWSEPGPDKTATQVALTPVVLAPTSTPIPTPTPEEVAFVPEAASYAETQISNASVVDLPSPPEAPQIKTPDAALNGAARSKGRAFESPAAMAVVDIQPAKPSPRAIVEPTPVPTLAPANAPAVTRATAPVTAPVATQTPLEELAANQVLGNFRQAYADGNLDGMRAMFTLDARSPKGGRDAILADYGRLFKTSSDRSLALSDVSWFTSGATFTIIATYQATVTSGRGGRTRRTQGDLRLDLRREDEQWRIYRLLHDERPG